MKKKRKQHINLFFIWNFVYLCTTNRGELAQLARALAWHARGHEFDSRILHKQIDRPKGGLSVCGEYLVPEPLVLPVFLAGVTGVAGIARITE